MLILRGLAGLPIAGVDVVEVAPPYDHAELTALAAANLAYECLALFALSALAHRLEEPPRPGLLRVLEELVRRYPPR